MKKLLASAIIAATPAMAQADLLFTVEAGASAWNAEATGSVTDSNNIDIDLEDDLGFDSETNNVLFVAFEHPIPVLPNIKIMKTDLDLEGDSNSQVDLTHTDLTMYWGLPLPIPYVDINFGLTARQFDGVIDVPSAANLNEDLDFVMPMGYLNVDIETPFGIYAYADLNALSFDGNGVTDTAIALGYTLPIPLVDVNLEAGHRSLSITTDEDTVDVETDIDVAGMFFGVNLSVGI